MLREVGFVQQQHLNDWQTLSAACTVKRSAAFWHGYGVDERALVKEKYVNYHIKTLVGCDLEGRPPVLCNGVRVDPPLQVSSLRILFLKKKDDHVFVSGLARCMKHVPTAAARSVEVECNSNIVVEPLELVKRAIRTNKLELYK